MEKARTYLPPSLRPVLDAYAKHIRAGNDEKAPQKQRAEDLWKAACIARYMGMELMGTEMDPDWAVYRGEFKESCLAETRAKTNFARLVKSSPIEMERVKRNAPVPDTRFHYRDIAVNLAWRAASLMPDESDRTAEVLCTAGAWLKEKDPQRADRFYRALVKRCGKSTELGKQANSLHWFPKGNIDREELLRKAM